MHLFVYMFSITKMYLKIPEGFPADFPPLLLLSGCENPKPCQTELTVLEYGLYEGDPVTKVLLQPLTGNSSYCFNLKYFTVR